MMRLFKNKKPPVIIHFRINPRDFAHSSVLLLLETIKALSKAADILQETSNGHYEIVLIEAI